MHVGAGFVVLPSVDRILCIFCTAAEVFLLYSWVAYFGGPAMYGSGVPGWYGCWVLFTCKCPSSLARCLSIRILLSLGAAELLFSVRLSGVKPHNRVLIFISLVLQP